MSTHENGQMLARASERAPSTPREPLRISSPPGKVATTSTRGGLRKDRDREFGGKLGLAAAA